MKMAKIETFDVFVLVNSSKISYSKKLAIADATKRYGVEWSYDGTYTVVKIGDRIGVAKRNSIDQVDIKIGFTIAALKALDIYDGEYSAKVEFYSRGQKYVTTGEVRPPKHDELYISRRTGKVERAVFSMYADAQIVKAVEKSPKVSPIERMPKVSKTTIKLPDSARPIFKKNGKMHGRIVLRIKPNTLFSIPSLQEKDGDGVSLDKIVEIIYNKNGDFNWGVQRK